MSETALVVTSIGSPSMPGMRALADGTRSAGWDFFVVGDEKSPSGYELPGARFLSREWQLSSGYQLARILRPSHYAVKMFGYLEAIASGSLWLIETDDDNAPLTDFWAARQQTVPAVLLHGTGWVNVYRWFTEKHVWPRGLPLTRIGDYPDGSDGQKLPLLSSIQQGLANGEPDVDAIYRLVLGREIQFDNRSAIALGQRWSPFNSQNTSWHVSSSVLMYLPRTCSFRMTDIWRSFVAVAITSNFRDNVTFWPASVVQTRNSHVLERDFEDEVEGYLHNDEIMQSLAALMRSSDVPAEKSEQLYRAYEEMVKLGVVQGEELGLVEAWIHDHREALARAWDHN